MMKATMILCGCLFVGSSVHFLATGNPDSFCFAFSTMILLVALWFSYELDLRSNEIENQIESWEIKRKRQQDFRIMLNRREMERKIDLMNEWQKI